jgi:hypothetical protein
MESTNTVNIRPGVNILSILKHIEYDPWYALAEFVDNAINSFQKYEKEIKEIDGYNTKLIVHIDLNDNDKKITIRDNAAGIHEIDYARAFRAAEIPPDTTGLSEFGMGMKSAACWFSDQWSVTSSAIGENVEKTVIFDLEQIFYDRIEELEIEYHSQKTYAHYTKVELYNINKMPINRTKSKIKDHLSSIYRNFFRKGTLNLYFCGEQLVYHDPKILFAPYPYDSSNPPILWKKEIDFEIEPGKMYVKGFVGLLESMESGKNGFALFRRGRVIEGSAEDAFKPKEIMGEAGNMEYKRIFGELNLEGFKVSFTKKGIKWDENMDIFLNLLRSDLTQPSFPLLKQARDYRVKPTKQEMIKVAETVVRSTVNKLKDQIQPAIKQITETTAPINENTSLTATKETTIREFEIDFNNDKWTIQIELSYDPAITDWIEVGSHVLKNNTSKIRQVGVRMSLNHKFVQHFAGTDKSKLEPILRIAAAIGLAEEAARETGLRQAGLIRRNLNKLLIAIAN